jgi:hypothetical protein
MKSFQVNEEVIHMTILKKLLLSTILFSYSHQTYSDTIEKTADLIIFSYDRPLQLHALLSSIKTYMYNLGTTYLICRMSTPAYEKAYQEVLDLYPNVVLLKQGAQPKQDFKPLVLKAFNGSLAQYILFCTDDLIMKDYVDIHQCINALDTYSAYGLYLRLGTHITYSYNQEIKLTIPKLSQVETGIYSWQFSEGKSYWEYPNSLDMALFKKSAIEKDLMNLSYSSPNILESRWSRLADKNQKGLCFRTSKAFNIPMNLVQEDWYNKHENLFSTQELLDMWNQGLMMDITSFHQIANTSAMMAYNPTFIPRPKNNIPEKKITVIIPSYNNALYYKENIESVLNQQYSNYHIIYIDDASIDGTGKLVQEYIQQHGLQDKITLIQNTYNRKALANIYRAIHMCHPQDLILELDGDDALAHNTILKEINSLFSTYDIWLAYAQYKNVPEEKARESKISIIGYAKPTPPEFIASRDIRSKWLWSGLRMFYAWLAQAIKLQDLLLPEAPYKGKFFPTSKDSAIIYPMLEMAGNKFMFIPSLWLMRNVDTPINDFKIGRELQKHCGAFLKSLPSYQLLEQKPTLPCPIANIHCPLARTDVIVASHNAQQLENFLLSLAIFSADTKNIYVLYNSAQEDDYALLRATHPRVVFIAHHQEPQSFTQAFYKALYQTNDYVLLSSDVHHVKQAISYTACIQELERTRAQALYLSADINSFGNPHNIVNIPCEQINEDIYAWKCSCFNPGKHALGTVLCKKEAVVSTAQQLHEFLLEDIGQKIYEQLAHNGSVSLFFEKKVINQ